MSKTTDASEQAQLLVLDRQRAYQQVFSPNVATEAVLKDLAKFCRAFESTYDRDDARASTLLEGRREVWLRIMEHLKLTTDELYKFYIRRQ